MYERMLNKEIFPTFDDMLLYCGETSEFWLILDKWIKDEHNAEVQIRFPYGKKYGWSVKYSKKSKHICDIFAEAGAFAVFLKINDRDFFAIQSELSDYAKEIYSNKYPCGEGGWIRYRVLSEEQLSDIKQIITAKIKP